LSRGYLGQTNSVNLLNPLLVPAYAIDKPLLGGPDLSDIGNDPAKRSGVSIDGCPGKMAFSRCRGNEFADSDI
jgi:hypothetical protein